jgi:phosphoglycerate dehydrogenase-like enzyme
MLMAHPAVLRNVIDQYDALRILHAEDGSAEVRRRMDDLTYTLCVSTGTRDIDAALIAARHQLPGARPEDDSVLSV